MIQREFAVVRGDGGLVMESEKRKVGLESKQQKKIGEGVRIPECTAKKVIP